MKSPKDMRIIQIDITNACMYQCSNCTRFCGHHKKNFFMDFDTFKRAVASMKGYHGTIGIMGGEPTLHPEFERFVKYLDSQLPKGHKKENTSLIRPQKDFIESILLENKENSEVYEYTTGNRETVVGAGLWSAMVPTYKKYYELIQDVFKMQAVNDHGNIMYHSPILINRKDLGISDQDWYKIRDCCWAQDIWSATITPKGAFFCEIAGALDMLFDGPGGWPIEEGWWKRTPDQFGEQLKWCEYCGIAIETFTRDANDWIDDVSESMLKKLEQIGSPKLKKGKINLVKIEDGVIAEESKLGAREVRRDLFYESFASRFNGEKSILYPKSIDVVIDLVANYQIHDIQTWFNDYRGQFRHITFITYSTNECGELYEIFQNEYQVSVCLNEGVWGHSFSAALSKCYELQPILYCNRLYYLKDIFFAELMETIINPGTLHFVNLAENSCDYLQVDSNDGVLALFHREASSLREVGYDYITNAKCFDNIVDIWKPEKIVHFSTDMIEDTSEMRIQSHIKYAAYGAGNTGKAALKQIRQKDSEVVLFSDSDSDKWGNSIEGIEIVSPEELFKRKDEYQKVIIASTYYKEIRELLEGLGFHRDCIVIYE